MAAYADVVGPFGAGQAVPYVMVLVPSDAKLKVASLELAALASFAVAAVVGLRLLRPVASMVRRVFLMLSAPSVAGTLRQTPAAAPKVRGRESRRPGSAARQAVARHKVGFAISSAQAEAMRHAKVFRDRPGRLAAVGPAAIRRVTAPGDVSPGVVGHAAAVDVPGPRARPKEACSEPSAVSPKEGLLGGQLAAMAYAVIRRASLPSYSSVARGRQT